MVLTWRKLHLAAMAEARRAHRELEIDVTQHIDPFAALESAGVLVFRRQLDSLAGVYIPGEYSDIGQPGVLINASHPLSRQRYTAAHELSHHRRDRQLVLDLDTEWLPRGDRPISETERFAEAFAAWFLMPRQLVQGMLETLNLKSAQLDDQGAYVLSLALGTSYAATVNHLADMSLITRAHRDRLIAIKPQSVKRATGGIDGAADAWKDVWLVRPPRRAAVDPQEGDAVIVEVTEIPSSGFLWQPIEVPAGVTLVRDEYVPIQADLLGGQGSHRFIFRVEVAGRLPLRFVLGRPWLGNHVSDTFELEIVAQPQPTSGLVHPERLIAAA